MNSMSPEGVLKAAGAIAETVSPHSPVHSTSNTHWHDLLQRDDRGRAIPNLANALTALRYAPELAALVTYDEMLRHALLLQPVPGSMGKRASGQRPLEDADVAAIQEWLQRHELPRLSKDVAAQAVDLVAREGGFHPVREYFSGLHWDGVPRLDTWLSSYLGCNGPFPYAAKIGRWFLISMIARIMDPGCKADYMLVLEGPQGAGKSTACAILGGQWFSDSLPDVAAGKDVAVHLNGKWLIEVAEMSALSKAETATLKAFITRNTERYRPPYGREEVIAPRQCIFIGTTNKASYLQDETGGRRFWPVRVGAVYADKLRQDRDQLLAEALVAYRTGERWWPDAGFEQEYIAPEQEARFEADLWEDKIRPFLAARYRSTISEIAGECLGLEVTKQNVRESRRIVAILERAKWAPNRGRGGRYWEAPHER